MSAEPYEAWTSTPFPAGFHHDPMVLATLTALARAVAAEWTDEKPGLYIDSLRAFEAQRRKTERSRDPGREQYRRRYLRRGRALRWRPRS